jgi:hypothetical protein
MTRRGLGLFVAVRERRQEERACVTRQGYVLKQVRGVWRSTSRSLDS